MRDTPTDSDFVGRGQEGSAKRFRRRAGQPDRKKLRASHLLRPLASHSRSSTGTANCLRLLPSRWASIQSKQPVVACRILLFIGTNYGNAAMKTSWFKLAIGWNRR